MNSNTHKRLSVSALVPIAAAAWAATTSGSASAEGVAQAARDTKAAFNVRYRMETVEHAGMENTAKASTAKARLSWIMPSNDGLSAGLEGDYVFLVGRERYNSTNNGLAEFPVVADPTGLDLNQAYVRYRDDSLTMTMGRQRINHGGQRLVGGVGWRQNEQTFDALRVRSSHREDQHRLQLRGQRQSNLRSGRRRATRRLEGKLAPVPVRGQACGRTRVRQFRLSNGLRERQRPSQRQQDLWD